MLKHTREAKNDVVVAERLFNSTFGFIRFDFISSGEETIFRFRFIFLSVDFTFSLASFLCARPFDSL